MANCNCFVITYYTLLFAPPLINRNIKPQHVCEVNSFPQLGCALTVFQIRNKTYAEARKLGYITLRIAQFFPALSYQSSKILRVVYIHVLFLQLSRSAKSACRCIKLRRSTKFIQIDYILRRSAKSRTPRLRFFRKRGVAVVSVLFQTCRGRYVSPVVAVVGSLAVVDLVSYDSLHRIHISVGKSDGCILGFKLSGP